MTFLKFLLLSLFLSATSGDNVTSSKLLWSAAVLGSASASRALLASLGPDKGTALIAVSVDGEVSMVNLREGTSLPAWPLYLSGEHFFTAPVQYTYGGSKTEDLFVIISQKGQIFYIDLAGIVVRTKKLHNVYLKKDWDFKHYKELSEIISKENDDSNLMSELYPQVFADVTLIDLNVDGVQNDLVIPVNFVSKESSSDKVIVSAIVVFDLAKGSIVDVNLISISKKDTEYPGYILTDVSILRKKDYHAIVTLTSGVIYQLQWNKKLRKFQTMPNYHITYNQGPYNCQPTNFCTDLKGSFLNNYMCCLYGDFYGHLAMMDLTKHKLMWEYNAAEEAIPTAPKIFQDDSYIPYAVFANSKGWIYCVSLLTGKSKALFPIRIQNDSFSSSAEVVFDLNDQLFLVLLSDKGHLFKIPIINPSNYISIFYHTEIASYLPPLILPSSTHSINIDMIVQSKTGFIFKIVIPNSKRKHQTYVRTDINNVNGLEIATLYGLGSVFSFNLIIHDPRTNILKVPQYYVIKVYVNEYLYYTHKEAHSGQEVTQHTVVINVDNVNKTLVPTSVFLFGTATIIVSDSMGLVLPPLKIYIRINYDFQFELIWIVYLTFFICCTGILLFHFSDYNSKLHIPFYVNIDS